MKIGDQKNFHVGTFGVKKIMLGSNQVWPSQYDCQIMAVVITPLEYQINRVPAQGGYANTQYWAIISQAGEEVTRINVTNSVTTTMQEFIEGQWAEAQNFHLNYDSTNNRYMWSADDRERNGITGSTGDQIPQSAPARQSRLKVSYSGTYMGVNVGAESEWDIMTQNANKVELQSSPYVHLKVNISRYGAAGSGAAPASGDTSGNTKATATYDQEFNYKFYDDASGEKVYGLAYQRTVEDAVTSERFSFSARQTAEPDSPTVDWISFPTITSAGAIVNIANRGTDDGDARDAYIRATFTGSGAEETTKTVKIYQAQNHKQLQTDVYNSYRLLIAASPDGERVESLDIDASEQYVYLFGTAVYADTYSWPSRAPSTMEYRYESQNPTRITTDPSVPSGNIDLANARIKIPANVGISNIGYTINGYYTEDSVEKGDDVSINQSFVALTFGELSIMDFEYEKIPASGGMVRPYVGVRLELKQGANTIGYATGVKGDNVDADSITIENTTYGVSKTVTLKYYVNNTLDSTNHGDVSANSRGYNEDTYNTQVATNCWVRAEISELYKTADSEKISVYQYANHKHVRSETFDHYSFIISPSSVGASGGTVSYYGYAYYNIVYWWDSLEPDTTGTGSEYQYPDSIEQTSGDTAQIDTSNHRITIPANTSGSDREFAFTAYYNGDDDTEIVDQEGVQYTYDSPVITFYYPEIPASGGNSFPALRFTQNVRLNGTIVDTISGQLEEGATSGYASDGSYFTVSFSGSSVSPGTFRASDGRVSIGSRGTAKENYTRKAAEDCRAYVSSHGQSKYSSYVDALQEENSWTTTPASVTCSSLVLVLDPSSLGSAAVTVVSVSGRASGTETSERTDFASGEHTGGDTTTYTNRIVALESLNVNNVSQSDPSTFTADNRYNTSTKSYSLEGTYMSKTATTSVTQAADSQSGWLTREYEVSISIDSNNISASGGSATVVADGSHVKYKKWASDDSDVSGSVSTVADFPTLSLVDISSDGVFTLSGSTVTHRDMTNNATTDYVKVRATNGSVTADTPLLSATNNKSYGLVTVTASQSTVAASGTISGYPITFSASAPIIWTSGYDEGNYTDFSFSIRVRGNSGKRTYSMDNGALTMGTLGTNEVTDSKYTYIRATPSVSAVGNGEVIITEAPNTVQSTQLTVNWNIPSGAFPGMGGTKTIRVSSASIDRVYSSGSPKSTSVTASTILNNTTASGTGFTLTHTYGQQISTLKAVKNPSTSASRYCTLTVSYQGLTATTQVEQNHINFEVSYVTNSGVINGRIKNTDTQNKHTFTYYAMYDGAVTIPETSSEWNKGETRIVAGGQASGHVLTVVVTKEDGVSEVT